MRIAIVVLMAAAGCRSPAVDSTPAPAPSTLPAETAASPAPSAAPSGAPIREAARWFALGWESPVRERPSPQSRLMGYVRAGGSVAISGPVAGREGCSGGWLPVTPAGFVCDAPGVGTRDANDEVVRALAQRPDTKAGLPYLYGIVRRAGPIYGRLPSRERAEREEPGLEARMREWLATDGENGASFRAETWARGQAFVPPAILWEEKRSENVPFFFEGGRAPPGNLGTPIEKDAFVVGKTRHHNGFAFIDTAVVDGRRYAITTNLLALPVDRLRPIEGSTFHGVEIPGDIDFPFAFIRRDGASAFREEKGRLVTAKDLPRRLAVKLTGKQKFFSDRLYFEMDGGLWVSDQVASRLDPAKKMPKWGKKGERWLDVNITKQTLVAYDGPRAVFATLVSTGEAGLGDPSTSRSTKRGIFRIHAKHVSATMDSEIVGEEFELRDIPYVQYFEGGYALHAAYWHDDFGKPRSHGCINLAPRDAMRLFHFTEPALPEGWHGVRKALTGSVVFVHP